MKNVKKIPCKTVEMMIEPEYCDKISENGTYCNCEYRNKLLEDKKNEM